MPDILNKKKIGKYFHIFLCSEYINYVNCVLKWTALQFHKMAAIKNYENKIFMCFFLLLLIIILSKWKLSKETYLE
jgi:hypothetical protein